MLYCEIKSTLFSSAKSYCMRSGKSAYGGTWQNRSSTTLADFSFIPCLSEKTAQQRHSETTFSVGWHRHISEIHTVIITLRRLGTGYAYPCPPSQIPSKSKQHLGMPKLCWYRVNSASIPFVNVPNATIFFTYFPTHMTQF